MSDKAKKEAKKRSYSRVGTLLNKAMLDSASKSSISVMGWKL